MLVLSRRPGERIQIGDNITLTVVESRNGRMCIGIDAPKDIPVHRSEVYDAIQRSKE